ncbi:electrogenic aspartate/glutamate antiporter SLC25A12, mitochondrial-like isoform X2 [Watersipora subatra]|uniref:electrogenic aspartate/glutamate antiporter SLC25A12, mitochondrial-like isoform X2 n=1 Tax=Watersipora subatra TaxID=2589382 RepID=UPI00355C4286
MADSDHHHDFHSLPADSWQQHHRLLSFQFDHAKCDTGHLPLPTSHMSRANVENLKEVFSRYASRVVDGERVMTYADFIQKYLGLLTDDGYNTETLQILGRTVDSLCTGYISFDDFQNFEGILCQPDALYRVAFHIFDRNSNGTLSFDEFRRTLEHTEINKFVKFNFDTDFVRLHFGVNRDRAITYSEFTQVLLEYHEEHALQAFRKFDKNKSGRISLKDLKKILVNICPHLLSTYVEASLPLLGENDSEWITYPYFRGFISLLSNMELIKKIYLHMTDKSKDREITQGEFMRSAQNFTQVTPLEVMILYQLTDLMHKNGKLVYHDLEAVAPLDVDKMPYSLQSITLSKTISDRKEADDAHHKQSVFMQILENIYRFALGAVAGATGATAVYPIDLVKTRMQNQRTSLVGELMYKNSWDCFKKVLRFEGVGGLYRGLGPQLVGVAPEKAIKLTMNDLMRGKLARKDGSLPLWAECVAGGCAGGSQVLFTNPLEIVKIRLQVAGEVPGVARPSAINVIRELGLLGLYKGARACLLRDIPFSAIYFPAYANLKKYSADSSGYNSPLTLLVSAFIAGAPAASLVTPADVIKTRLQVAARKGQSTYNGVIHCFRTILKEEGGRAFWKGTTARVFRSSPQFAVTLVTYEMLHRLFYVDFGGRKPEGSTTGHSIEDYVPPNPDHIGGYKFVRPTFEGIETRFGLCFPKYKSS